MKKIGLTLIFGSVLSFSFSVFCGGGGGEIGTFSSVKEREFESYLTSENFNGFSTIIASYNKVANRNDELSDEEEKRMRLIQDYLEFLGLDKNNESLIQNVRLAFEEEAENQIEI